MILSFYDWFAVVSAVIFGNGLWFVYLKGLRQMEIDQAENRQTSWLTILGGLAAGAVAIGGFLLVK